MSQGQLYHASDSTIVIMGASGDLTARKLLPALFALWKEGFLADNVPIVGVARREKSDEAFREEMEQNILEHCRIKPDSRQEWNNFARRLFYHVTDLTDSDDYLLLKKRLEDIEFEFNMPSNRMYYMAIAPSLFLPVVESLHTAGLIPDRDSDETIRVVIEKPFGRDLESAQHISQELSRMLTEDQIYRIDHYLGKETVQNILLFRFGNSIFEPLLNRNHVDHVQITVAESQGIEGGRGAYYDKSGALRDVLQNHVLQLLCLLGMEPPALFRAEAIRDEKLKVLQAMAPGHPTDLSKWAVAGQFSEGEVDGEHVPGYRQEDRVPPNSTRETFVAMEVKIDNWRWAGVPFYLRTGKRMPERVTEIAIQFKLPPLHLFGTVECEGDICDLVGARPNTLVFRIQPKEAISLVFSTKRPGMQYQIQPVRMEFAYDEAFDQGLPEAYERLLLDVLRGDSTLFTRSDELEAAWQFIDPVLKKFDDPASEPEFYKPGTWGPEGSNKLLARNGHRWRVPGSEHNRAQSGEGKSLK
ncbi:MAG: glucose-6-phosphate dehydrogenase [Planctomycetaceae bacterium]|nr:glucose-6-phosphate dehydrogenase [Planctomycetaceae bacterium]